MPVDVLLVEDNLGDVWLTREAFRSVDRDIVLHVVTDGAAAIDFVTCQGVHRRAPRPDLIFLDLNLPKMDGREVLARLKGDGSLKLIPTIVLTASGLAVDITRAYELRANCYLCKPQRLEEFETVLTMVIDFWLLSSRLPRFARTL